MAKINLNTDPTLEAVDAAMVAASKEEIARGYVGMSAIGNECDRRTYNDFHWLSPPNFNAKTLKMFADGHLGEDVQAERLRLVKGIQLITHEADGGQIGYKDLGGHYAGHMDGAIVGLLQAPKTWHVWEHKQTAESKFKELSRLIDTLGEKNALREWNQTYYGQAVTYMHYSGMKRHYMTVATPGGRNTLSLRTEANPAYAERLVEKARDIITSDKPQNLERISDKPDYYYCQFFCGHADTCHGDTAPQVNCRTCAHSTAHIVEGSDDAIWRCHISPNAHDIPLDIQRQGCPSHIYNPHLLENWAEAIGSDLEGNTISYMHKKTKQTFTNGIGAGFFTSAEIFATDSKLLGDDNINILKTEFGGVSV